MVLLFWFVATLSSPIFAETMMYPMPMTPMPSSTPASFAIPEAVKEQIRFQIGRATYTTCVTGFVSKFIMGVRSCHSSAIISTACVTEPGENERVYKENLAPCLRRVAETLKGECLACDRMAQPESPVTIGASLYFQAPVNLGYLLLLLASLQRDATLDTERPAQWNTFFSNPTGAPIPLLPASTKVCRDIRKDTMAIQEALSSEIRRSIGGYISGYADTLIEGETLSDLKLEGESVPICSGMSDSVTVFIDSGF